MPFSPCTEIATLIFLATVVVLMAFEETGRITLYCLPVIGWFSVRKRINMDVFEKAKL